MPDNYIAIPSGPSTLRPANPESGYLRYNTEGTGNLEVYNGSAWINLDQTGATAVTIPAYRNPSQYPASPVKGMMVFNETTQKVEVYNGRDWRPGANVPLMRRVNELPDLIVPDSNDFVIIEQSSSDPVTGQDVSRTFKTKIYDFVFSPVFGEGVDYRINQLTTNDLEEGINNLYFTIQRARTAITVDDQEGFGAISYDAGTGVITYRGTTQANVWSSLGFEYGDTASYDENTGVFTFPGEFDDPTFNSVRVRETITDRLTFTGTGPVSLNSSNDLILDAQGNIRLTTTMTLPSYSLAELEDIIDVPLGTCAYCSDPEIGGPRPVQYTSLGWRDYTNGDIYDITDDF